MKCKIEITYNVEAQGDETEADEERMLDAISELAGTFANQIVDAGRSEGLTVRVESDGATRAER